jgi:hypothetical protein
VVEAKTREMMEEKKSAAAQEEALESEGPLLLFAGRLHRTLVQTDLTKRLLLINNLSTSLTLSLQLYINYLNDHNANTISIVTTMIRLWKNCNFFFTQTAKAHSQKMIFMPESNKLHT